MTVHRINPELLERRVEIALIGAGGSGSQMLTGLARLDRALRALGHPRGLHVRTYDPDSVSEANIGRQLFSPSDVGLPKAFVLTHRVNCFYGLEWEARSERYTGAWEQQERPGGYDILITCVDTAAARRTIYKTYLSRGPIGQPYWLDLGNQQKDGQVILGQFHGPVKPNPDKKGKGYSGPIMLPLPSVVDLFPELLDETLPEDDRPSCSLAESLESQDLFINDHVSRWALQLLWTLFREGRIEHHGYFINLADGSVNPLPVAERATHV